VARSWLFGSQPSSLVDPLISPALVRAVVDTLATYSRVHNDCQGQAPSRALLEAPPPHSELMCNYVSQHRYRDVPSPEFVKRRDLRHRRRSRRAMTSFGWYDFSLQLHVHSRKDWTWSRLVFNFLSATWRFCKLLIIHQFFVASLT
jgi:hypothetical protein